MRRRETPLQSARIRSRRRRIQPLRGFFRGSRLPDFNRASIIAKIARPLSYDKITGGLRLKQASRRSRR